MRLDKLFFFNSIFLLSPCDDLMRQHYPSLVPPNHSKKCIHIIGWLLPTGTIPAFSSPQLGTTDPIICISLLIMQVFGAGVLPPPPPSLFDPDIMTKCLSSSSNSTGAQYVRERACKWKLDVKTCQFGSALVFARSCLRLCKRGTATKAEHFAREKCNKYDLTTIPCFWLANHLDCSRWFSMNCLLSIEVPVSVLWAGVDWK